MANLPYIQVTSANSQTITTADTPQVIVIDTIEDKNEFDLNVATGVITYNKAGAARKFAYISGPQVAREDECNSNVPNFRHWIQKKTKIETEFSDVPNTNVIMNVNRHRETKDVLTLNGLITLEKDDEIRFMMASNVDSIVKIEAIPMTGEPDVPSIIVSIFNIGLEKDEVVEEV